MVSSAGYVASSDVIVGSGGWFPGPLQRRGGVLPILLKSGDRFDGLFDTEMSCGPLFLSSLTQVDFIACHGFPIICFSKSAKGIAIVVLVVAVSLLSPVHIPVPVVDHLVYDWSVFGDEGRVCNRAFGCTVCVLLPFLSSYSLRALLTGKLTSLDKYIESQLLWR
ncbi:hypothetical protein F2Q70_00020858 [Brassica cretica]|uniref:Uncharacterized protein n=1 Tax=Brassica cretica TaxID=69181 RepID=A0A8S9GQL4_BRACR|nr:hypothetical protein F2Q70_00020858 [Brassica cretica]